jgi:hypothetical protein
MISLVLDNSRYNRYWKVKELACDLGFELIYLPAYSPNLNPIERVWKFFKYIRKLKGELTILVTDNFEVIGACKLKCVGYKSKFNSWN